MTTEREPTRDPAPQRRIPRNAGAVSNRDFYFVSGVAVVAMLAAIALVMMADTPPAYRTSLAIFLACFPVSTAVSMLAAVRGNIHGTIGFATFSLAGGAAVTAVFYLLIIYAPIQIAAGNNVVVVPSNDPTWATYDEWLGSTGIKDVYAKHEEDSVTRLIGCLHYPGNEHVKPKNPTIQALIAYSSPQYAVAFRRVTAASVPSESTVEFFSYYSPTLPDSKISVSDQFLYQRRGDRINLVPFENSSIQARGRWTKIKLAPNEPLDCLIVTIYDEPGLQQEAGDYLTSELSKWMDMSAKPGAKVVYSIVSHTPTKLVRLWEVNTSVGSSEAQTPLSFSRSPRFPDANVTALAEHSQSDSTPAFREWLEKLDIRGRKRDLGALEAGMFRRIDAALRDEHKEPIPISSVLTSPYYSSRSTFTLAEARRPFVVTLLWDKH